MPYDANGVWYNVMPYSPISTKEVKPGTIPNKVNSSLPDWTKGTPSATNPADFMNTPEYTDTYDYYYNEYLKANPLPKAKVYNEPNKNGVRTEVTDPNDPRVIAKNAEIADAQENAKNYANTKTATDLGLPIFNGNEQVTGNINPTDPSNPYSTIQVADTSSEPWNAFFKAPSEGDIDELASLYKTSYGYPDVKARARAKEVLNRNAEDLAKTEAKNAEQEQSITGYLKDYPETQKKIRSDLATELGKYQSTLYKDELLPAIYESMNTKGLSGGALDQAIAKSAERLSSAREQNLSGLGTQSALTGSQLELENLLRRAGESGTTAANLKNIANQYNAESRTNAFNAGQSDLAKAFQKEMQNLTYKQNVDYYNMDRANKESDLWKQALGNIIGTGVKTLAGGIIAGPAGAMSGLTNTWWTGK